MSSYNPQTDIASLPTNSNGVRRIKEVHINASDGAVNERLEALSRALYSVGGVTEIGTIIDAAATVRVQNRGGISLDGLLSLFVLDQTADLSSVATGIKCRVVIASTAIITPVTFTDIDTGQSLTHNLTARLGKVQVLQGTSSVYPTVPADCVTVGQYTKTGAATMTRDALENTAPTLRAGGGVSSIPYDVTFGYSGAPAANAELRFLVARAFTLYSVANLPSGVAHQCKAVTAATASTTLTIRKNGSSIGTMVFAASGTVATFTVASNVTFASGDVLSIIAPATPDTTLANVDITLAAVI